MVSPSSSLSLKHRKEKKTNLKLGFKSNNNPWIQQLQPNLNKVETQISKIMTHNYIDKISEPKPKSQPNFFFHQLRREKTQRRSTITQRQNSNPYFLASNTKLNIDFLMLSKKPNSKLKSQIDEQNPRSETTNSHGFREKERERESWVFGQGWEREGRVFSLRELGFG